MVTSALSILIAGISSSIIGFLWYHPRVFGMSWMRMSGIQPQHAAGKKGMIGLAFLGFASSIAMALVVRQEIVADLSLYSALSHMFLLWFGLVATVILGVVLWERKPLSLYLITIGYWLLSLMVMTSILFYLH